MSREPTRHEVRLTANAFAEISAGRTSLMPCLSGFEVDDELYIKECNGAREPTGREILADIIQLLVDDITNPRYRVATVRPWLLGTNLSRFIADKPIPRD